MSGAIIRLTPEIREEMRGLKATGMTCGEVAAEVEKRHGLRPSSANTRLICKGIAPQRKGRAPGAPAGMRPRIGRAIDWARLTERARAENNRMAEEAIEFARDVTETYIRNIKEIRHALGRYMLKATEKWEK
jgi:hypothetical protein